MRRKILLAVALVIAVGLAPRTARACGQGGYGGSYAALATAAVAIGAADVVLTLWDGGSAVLSHHPSPAYGVVETAIAMPQLALGLVGLAQPNQSYKGGIFLYTAWMALLTTHGIWTIATAPRETTATVEGPEPRAAVARSAPEPVLQVGVGPTYVPLGPLSQPGFGLVGRF